VGGRLAAEEDAPLGVDEQCGANRSTTERPLALHSASASALAMMRHTGDQRVASQRRKATGPDDMASPYEQA
jgi:hypothetical protein